MPGTQKGLEKSQPVFLFSQHHLVSFIIFPPAPNASILCNTSPVHFDISDINFGYLVGLKLNLASGVRCDGRNCQIFNACGSPSGLYMIQLEWSWVGHCGCGFSHVLTSLRTFLKCIRFKDITSHPQYSICQHLPGAALWSQGNQESSSNPSQSLHNKHLYFLPAPVIILDKQLT